MIWSFSFRDFGQDDPVENLSVLTLAPPTAPASVSLLDNLCRTWNKYVWFILFSHYTYNHASQTVSSLCDSSCVAQKSKEDIQLATQTLPQVMSAAGIVMSTVGLKNTRTWWRLWLMTVQPAISHHSTFAILIIHGLASPSLFYILAHTLLGHTWAPI